MCPTTPSPPVATMDYEELGLLQEASWPKVHRMVCKLVHRHRKIYGGNLQELMAEANYCFAHAVYTWKPDKGALTTHVWHQVRCGLLNQKRAALKHKAKSNKEEALDWQVSPSQFNLRTFLREMSADASIVAMLALGTPREVLELLLDKPHNKVAQRSCRSMLVEFLISLGWGAGRVLAAFREVRESLQG